jgi:hypothetical protein
MAGAFNDACPRARDLLVFSAIKGHQDWLFPAVRGETEGFFLFSRSVFYRACQLGFFSEAPSLNCLGTIIKD